MSVYATAWSTTPRSTAIRRRSRRGAASATAAEVLMLPWLLLLVCAIEIGELRAGRARGNNNLSKLLLHVWFGVTCGEGLLICISSCWLIGQVKDFLAGCKPSCPTGNASADWHLLRRVSFGEKGRVEIGMEEESNASSRSFRHIRGL